MLLIKDAIESTPLYFYCLSHSENEFLQTLMDMSFVIDANIYYSCDYKGRENERDYATYICYQSIIKNEPDTVHDIIAQLKYNSNEELLLSRIAIEENNREVIELLYKSGLKYTQYVRLSEGTFISILAYAYINHGSEIIKFMCDIDANLNDCMYHDFFECIANDIDLISYLEGKKVLNNNFTKLIQYSKDPLLILDLFADTCNKINGDQIFCALAQRSPDIVKSVLEYGININSNAPLKEACLVKNIELIKFYLQYGLQVDRYILALVLQHNRYYVHEEHNIKIILDLFLEYDVDFSVLKYDNVDYDFLAKLECRGLDKDALLKHFIFDKLSRIDNIE